MQIHSFVSPFHLEHFTRLRALALDQLHSSRAIRTVIGQCHQLIQSWFDQLFIFERWSIESFYYGSEDLDRLFQHTSHLRHLCLVRNDDAVDGSLRFSVYGSSAIISDLLRKPPSLRYLIAETDDVNWDGYWWQQFITDRLPESLLWLFPIDCYVLFLFRTCVTQLETVHKVTFGGKTADIRFNPLIPLKNKSKSISFEIFKRLWTHVNRIIERKNRCFIIIWSPKV